MAQPQLVLDFLENREGLYAFAFALTREVHAAEEIFQDAALAILDEASKGTQANPFLPWARELVRRRVAEYFRKQSKRRLREQLTGSMSDAISQVFEENTVTPEVYRQHRQYLLHCLQRLAGRAREVVERRYRQEMSIAQIAQALNWDGASVRVALARARKSLSQCVHSKRRLQDAL